MTAEPSARARGAHPAVEHCLVDCLRDAPSEAHRDAVRTVFERASLDGADDRSLGALVAALRADELRRRSFPIEPRGAGSLERSPRPAAATMHACVSFVDGTLRSLASSEFESAYFDAEGEFRECHDRAILRVMGVAPVARHEVGRLVAVWLDAARARRIPLEEERQLLAALFEGVGDPLSVPVEARIATLSVDLSAEVVSETLALRARLTRRPTMRRSQAWFLALTKTLGFGPYCRVDGDYVACAIALESGLPVIAYCQDSTSRAGHVVALVRRGEEALLFDSGAPGETRTTLARLRVGDLDVGGLELRTCITQLLVPERC